MPELYVNDIVDENGITIGLAALNKTVIENLKIIYTPEKLASIGELLRDNVITYFYDRFCQFIVFAQYSEQQGLTMTVSDYNHNIKNVIDEYLEWAEGEWKQNDIDKIMQLFREIETDSNNIVSARMVLKDAI